MHKYILLLLACGCTAAGTVEIDDNPIDNPSDTDNPGDVGSPNEDDDNDGYSEAEGDCDDGQPAINPSATDIVGDDIDQNCDGIDGFDADGDGYADLASGGDDCDDSDHFTFPGAVEIWYDGIAQDCEDRGAPGWGDSDQDGDGFDADFMGGDDCVDTNADIHSLLWEFNGNGVDDNCNGEIDNLSLTLTWTPGLTLDDLNDPTTLVMSVEGEGLNPSYSVLEIWDFQTGGEAVVELTHDGTTLTHDSYAPGDGSDWWDAISGPSVFHTFKWTQGEAWGCVMWGADAAALAGSLGCTVLDPTL